MPKNKRNRMQQIKEFFMPTPWKIFGVVVLYFGSYILSFYGLLLNAPVYYFFYWNRALPTGFEGLVAFVIHIAYLYLLICIIAKLLS